MSNGLTNRIPHNHQYRADIDGLRAIAVLSVVAFHTFPTLISGGFIGVDIFVVITPDHPRSLLLGWKGIGATWWGGNSKR